MCERTWPQCTVTQRIRAQVTLAEITPQRHQTSGGEGDFLPHCKTDFCWDIQSGRVHIFLGCFLDGNQFFQAESFKKNQKQTLIYQKPLCLH